VVNASPVLVDHRERNSLVPDALVAAGLDIRLTDLPVGDYVLGPGLAVERKAPQDLGASIRDGRLFEQAARLQSTFAQAVLLIEGEPRMAEDAWRGAVCRLIEDGFTVVHSLDAADSAAWIVRLAKRARRSGPTPPAYGPRRAVRHPSAQAEAMLSVVPGISPTMARSLLASFGSIAAIAAAAPDGLRSHPGIGKVRAVRLADALHARYVDPADRQHAGSPGPGGGAPHRWVLVGPDQGGEAESFDRRAVALRALESAAEGTQLIDGLTGEVCATAPSAGSR
jgi:DNA excision repair protein ERCC-4